MGIYNFVPLIAKLLLELVLSLSVPAADKTQYFVRLSFNSILQLIYGILSDLQKLLTYFNGTEIVSLLRIPLFPSVSVFPKTLVLYSKDLNYYYYQYLH